MARIVEFIEAERLAGKGTDADPYRNILQLWTKEGELVAEYDPLGDSFFVQRKPSEPLHLAEVIGR